jgi:MFS family permease
MPCLVHPQTYYGISLALNGLQGSIYVTFLIAAAAEVPSNVLAAFMIERVGRHNTLAAGTLLAGVGSLLCALVPAGSAQAVMAAVSKFGCAGAFSVASIFTSELFPTLVRSAVLGLENEAARAGGIAAPFIVLAGSQMHNAALPFLLFGCTSLVASFLIITLPETLGAPMPDSMQDMATIQSVFTTSEPGDASAPSDNHRMHEWRLTWTVNPRT